MGIRDKLKDFKSRLSDRHMYSIVLTVTAIIAAVSIYQYKRALDYQGYVENGYNRAFADMVDSVKNMNASLAKGLAVTDPKQMALLSSEISTESAFAQANL